MKNVTLFILLLSASMFSQNFQGKATYKTHRKIDFKIDNDKKGKGAPNSEIQKKIQAQLMKQFQQTYTLNFDQSVSTYKQNKKLSSPQAQVGGVQIQVMGSGGGNDVLYKNIKDKRYVNKTEISGKRFLIKDRLENFDWKMTGVTKNIGNYTCYKATKTRKETRTSMSMTDGETEEKKEEVTIETVAWYTPEIPISNGPGQFWGLPGLILEVQDGKQTIACTEIVLNPSEKIEIKEPTKGKKVTQKEFDTIMDEHTKDIKERFRNKRKSKDGNSFQIEIQG
ncbi:GLPGLI family protein [Tenacibaculum sp. 1_MG-2023]|uniref:GLPGLI family protein n=1 Tax=Tenacibaculum sp. 1_MG-2023 TaxID=3062653 RepID=UPI0026E1A33C|nr:GLPGLI family protein [Tenacibaculum sp. 1_MG-2023]MDO6676266.1 GLPGLI family protein [Tenacibaculum sp. 1_MG-2023]